MIMDMQAKHVRKKGVMYIEDRHSNSKQSSAFPNSAGNIVEYGMKTIVEDACFVAYRPATIARPT